MVGKRQSEYPDRVSDALDKVLACENPDPAGDNSVPGRPTAQIGITDLSGTSTLIAFADSPYTLQRNNEIVLVDTSGGDTAIIVPTGWPDDSKFTVGKTSRDQFAVVINSTETLQPIRVASTAFVTNELLVSQSESVSYVKKDGVWYLQTNSINSYSELYSVPIDPQIAPGDPGGPIELTLIPQTIPLELDTNIFSRTLLFSSLPSNGLFISAHNMVLTLDVQVQLLHTIGANNGDVWAQLEWSTSASPENQGTALSQINAAFSHARTGDFGDTKSASSLLNLIAGETFQLQGVILEQNGGSSSDIFAITVAMTVT